MAIKTFNVHEDVYRKFHAFCKDHGVSMSKQVEMFMVSVIAEPKVKKEYLAKLDRIEKGRFIRVKDFAKRYG